MLPLAILTGLWVTRMQQAQDSVGMYAGNLIVNLALVVGLFLVANSAAPSIDPAASEAEVKPCNLLAKTSAQQAVAINGVIDWLNAVGLTPISRGVRVWL